MASHESQLTSHESPSPEVRGALKTAMGQLREAGVPSPTLAAELLLMHVLGCDRAWLYAHPEHSLDRASVARYFDLVARRRAGTPTQYLTGRQEFWGLELEVTPDVLIPRPETEHVVEVALERLGPRRSQLPLRLADVCTGSGCLAAALARELPEATIFATDVSGPALAVARRNAARHGFASRIHFVQCSLLSAFLRESRVPNHKSRPFDLILSNPPYIPRAQAALLPREVREHEPAQALFGGEAGSELYAPLVQQAAALLPPNGILVLELGYNIGPRVLPLLDFPGGPGKGPNAPGAESCWANVAVTNDLAGIPRVLAAERV